MDKIKKSHYCLTEKESSSLETKVKDIGIFIVGCMTD